MHPRLSHVTQIPHEKKITKIQKLLLRRNLPRLEYASAKFSHWQFQTIVEFTCARKFARWKLQVR